MRGEIPLPVDKPTRSSICTSSTSFRCPFTMKEGRRIFGRSNHPYRKATSTNEGKGGRTTKRGRHSLTGGPDPGQTNLNRFVINTRPTQQDSSSLKRVGEEEEIEDMNASCSQAVLQELPSSSTAFQPIQPPYSNHYQPLKSRPPKVGIENDPTLHRTKPSKRTLSELERSVNPTFRVKPPTSPNRRRKAIPCLPEYEWTDTPKTWNLMCWKNEIYQKKRAVLENHPSILPRMRAILLDWMTEVCEVYKLHRETYYLAMDYLDRYLCLGSNVDRDQLQLFGTTALFIASKVEEIYPPKCAEFAFVTDGACTEESITACEVIMVMTLNWGLSPVTPSHWLLTYMQLLEWNTDSRPFDKDRLLPKFHTYNFLQLSRLLDLCTMDVASLGFRSDELAASAMYLMYEPKEIALVVSGFAVENLKACVEWMSPFADALRETSEAAPRVFTDVKEDDFHNIQTHEISMELYDRALALAQIRRMTTSPEQQNSNIFPTPPASEERPGPPVRIPAYHQIERD